MRAVVCLFLLFGLCAYGTIITVSNEDIGATSAGPFPNTDDADDFWSLLAGSFGTITTIDFEDAPLGTFSSLSAAQLNVPGVDIGPLGDNDGDDTSIENTDQGNTAGFNTTSGGSQFLYFDPNQITPADLGIVFNFVTPVSGFGARFIGVGTSPGFISVEFDSGTTQTYLLSGDPGGGVQFFGFIDDTNLISSVSVWARTDNGALSDVFGIDDVKFVNEADDPPPTGEIPEPSSAGLALLGLAGLAIGAFGRRKKQ